MAVDFDLRAVERHLGPTASKRRGRSQALRKQLLLADVLAGAAAGAVGASFAGMSALATLTFAVGLTLAWTLTAFLYGLYSREDLRSWASGVGEAPKLLLACLTLSWPLFGMLIAAGASDAARGAIVATVALAAASGVTRAAARVRVHRESDLEQRTVIIGSGYVADRLVARLRVHPELGLRPVGFLDDDPDVGANSLPWLGGIGHLSELIAENRVDRVMIAFTRAHHEELLDALRVSRDAGVAVDVVPRLFEFLDGARTVDQIGGMPLLSIDVPTFSRPSRVAKRLLDMAGAATGLLVLLPFLLTIALAIKLDSRGPILFRQTRTGRDRRPFTLYKFRSMYVGTAVEVRADGAIVKGAEDARVTRVGRVIRRFSLDEAPQLWNVFKGDMSLVGPRPLVLAESDALTLDWHARRADLRPGLTGPWQIAGRSHIPFQEMIRFDYQYVAGWSLARDIEILLATFPTVLSGRGAF